MYRIGASTFAVHCRDKEQIKRLHELFLSYLPKRWEIEDEVIKTNYCYYLLAYEGDDTSFEKLVQWIHYARSDHKAHHKQGELITLRYDIMTETERQREVLRYIEEAILDQRMEIHMQPVYSLEQDKITSLEVLSRMKDQEGNFISFMLRKRITVF